VSPIGIEATLEKMAPVVDPACGIVRAVLPNSLEQGDPRVFVFGAVSCEASPLTTSPRVVHAGGAAVQRSQAIAATIGEAIERYCAAYSNPDDFVFASYSELHDEAIHPADFCLYSSSQYKTRGFPFKPFTEDLRVSWARGFSLQRNTAVLIPASLTHLPLYSDALEQEPAIALTTSTGLACGNTLEEAILSGIGEVVERDSLTCFWMNALPPRRTVVDESSHIFETFKRNFALPGLEYRLCNITTDLGIPTFFTLLVGGSNVGLMVNAGSQASLSPTRAALKSLVEAAHGRPYVRFILEHCPKWRYNSDFSTVNDFKDHAAFYTRAAQHHDALDFIRHAEPEAKLSDAVDLSTGSVLGDIETYLRLLGKHGLDVIVKDLTSPDIEELGLKVVRVLIPGLQLLHGDHRFPFLGCPRLFAVKRALGLGDAIVAERDLNRCPHPVP
jgi:ribosomal protein S12 methylthiotransferase accessory factor